MRKLIIFLFLLLPGFHVIAQVWGFGTVLTPKGTSVESRPLTSGEMSASTKNSLKNQTLAQYPGVTFLADATWTYNCHGYAWHIAEGGTPTVWINAIDNSGFQNVHRYWNDGSYIQVCNEADADKIHYYSGDHSAINSTAVAGKYESKWGGNIRLRHNPTQVPAIYIGTDRRYYATTKITGSTANLCTGTRVFSVKSIPGATYSWTYSSGLLAVGATNQASFTVQRNGSSSGLQTVQVSITTPCSGVAATRSVSFNVGSLISPLVGTLSTSQGTTSLNTVNFVKAGSIFVSFSWPGITGISCALTPGSPSGTGFFSTSGTFGFNIAANQNISVNITGTDGCGSQAIATRTFVASAFRLSTVSASPNPAKGIVNLKLEQEGEIPENAKGFTQIRLYDLKTNLQVKQWKYYETKTTSYPLNIAGLKQGVYLLKAERNGQEASVKLFIE